MRDLAWACFSPQMLHLEQLADTPTGVSASTMPLTRARARWLQQLDRDPSALLTQLSSRPTHRLGVYFEQLWHFFLRSDPAVELVAHNLAIHDEGRTLGEFDCIYYCADRACHVHLENMAREIALKGYLFQPLYEAPPSPPGFNRACTMHKWVSYQQLESHCAALDAMSFAILPKMQWLSRAQCDASETRLTQQQLLASLPGRWQADHYPLLIAALDEAHSEVSRFFVTPGRWPDSIARSATRSAL